LSRSTDPIRLLTGVCLGIALALPAHTRADEGRVWEIDGVRLERAQVARLADDMATRTLQAVRQKVEGIDLRSEQEQQMLAIYRGVALEVFAAVVSAVERGDLADDAKDAEIRRLVIEGQQRSHAQLEKVFDERQLALYSAWEAKQVDAYQNRRWDRRGRRERR
jgi:hypothetical protein